MGALSNLIWYKIGKRRGRRSIPRGVVELAVDHRNEECIHYVSFCQSFGNCDGGECEFDS